MLTGFWIESVFFWLSCVFFPVYVRTRNGLVTSHSWPLPPFVSVDVSSKTLQNWEWMSGVYQKSHANKRPGACCFPNWCFFSRCDVTFRDAHPSGWKKWMDPMTLARLELKRLFAAAWLDACWSWRGHAILDRAKNRPAVGWIFAFKIHEVWSHSCFSNVSKVSDPWMSKAQKEKRRSNWMSSHHVVPYP